MQEVDAEEARHEEAHGTNVEMDGQVNRAMFDNMLAHPDFKAALSGNGITQDFYDTIANTLFLTEDQQPRTLDFEEEFISEVAELSPFLSANVIHAAEVRLFGRTAIKTYKQLIDDKMAKFDRGQDLVIDRLTRAINRIVRKGKSKKTDGAPGGGA